MAATEAATDASGPRFAPDDPTLPEPWKGLIDGNTGMLYYWNQETNVTQYERPGETSAANTIPASVPQQSNASTPAPQQQMLYQNQYPGTVQQQAGFDYEENILQSLAQMGKGQRGDAIPLGLSVDRIQGEVALWLKFC